MTKRSTLCAAVGAAVIAAAAAGGWAYSVHEAGARLDLMLSGLSAEPLWNTYRVEAEVLERTFASRRFRIRVDDGASALFFNGTAEFGLLGGVVKVKTDASQGAAATLEKIGISGFSDELTVTTGLMGGVKQAVYSLGELRYRHPNSGEALDFAGMTIEAKPLGEAGWQVHAALPGLMASAGGQTVLSWKDLSAVYEEEAPSGSAEAAKAAEAASGGVLSAQEEIDDAGLLRAQRLAVRSGEVQSELGRFAGAELEMALAPQPADKAQGGKGESEARWQETMRFSLEAPLGPTLSAYGLKPDRMTGAMRITGITQAFVDGLAALSAGYLVGTNLEPIYALSLFQNAVLNDGLAWHLDDFTISQGADSLAMAGWLACQPEDAAALVGSLGAAGQPEVALGSFSFRATPAMLSPRFVDDALKNGTLKQIDNALVSDIRVTSERITANGVPIF